MKRYLHLTVRDLGHGAVVYGMERVPLGPDANTYQVLRDHVQGYIEYAPMPADCPFELIVNEEGRYTKPFNGQATQFYTSVWRNAVDGDMTQLSAPHLEIYGDVIITGRDEGDVTDELFVDACRRTKPDPHTSHLLDEL